MGETPILDRLSGECIFTIQRRGEYYVIRNKFDGSQFEVLTSAELIQLADELRELAGEELDHA
jgi:hypothetical protein